MHKATLPYGRQWVDDSDIAAVTRTLAGDWLTTGPAVDAFETALAQTARVSRAVAVNSGTAALHVAYYAAGLEIDDEIVTSPLTFVATASCALQLGANVRFADVDPATGNLNPSAAAALVTDRCRMIVPVDYAGHPADYEGLRSVADTHGLSIVADSAHALGATRNGKTVAELADIATTSFHPVKMVTTAEGGAVFTSNLEWAHRAERFRNHGIERDPSRQLRKDGRADASGYYEVQHLGCNYRMPDLLCALGLSQLQRLDAFVARRQAIAARYSSAFSTIDALELPTVELGSSPSWHLYVARVRDAKRRDPFFRGLQQAGLGVQVHYPPVYLHPAFEALGYEPGLCPVAEDFAARAISLPIFPAMSDGDVERVIETVETCCDELL